MIDQTTLAAIRYGYGLPLPDGAAGTPAAILDLLRGPDLAAQMRPIAGMAEVLPLLQRVQAGRMMMGDDKANREAFLAATQAAVRVYNEGSQTIFARAIDSGDGFRERLAAFWTDHFTTKPRNPSERTLTTAIIDDAIRPNMTGQFGDLLEAAVLHPAMLVYLDQVASVGPGSVFGQRRARGLNENLAREVLELHTLGVGAGYGQDDVRQMAMLLTGLDATAKDGFVFRAARAEPGAEVVLGKRYEGEGLVPIRAVLQDLALRPETAAHIARKLAVHFVSDTPEPALVAALTQAYSETGGDLMAVYAALLNHPAAWEPVLHKARQPYDFMVAALRALGVTGENVMQSANARFRRMVLNPMTLMGQAWHNPVGPDGWQEATQAWITPQGLGARIAWGMEMPARLVPILPDPRDFPHVALGSAADERLIWAAERAESVREGVGLVFASPAFNRR